MIIYKCQNKISKKVYIGQTVKSLDSRIQQHIKKANTKAKSKFHKALLSYGIDNFEWSIVATANSKQKLNELEIYYISEYNSISNGYNMIDGGTGGYNEYAVIANKLKKGKSWEEIYSSKDYIDTKKKLLKSQYNSKLRKYNFANMDVKIQKKISKKGGHTLAENGYRHSIETKKKISDAQIGITYEQRHGIEISNKLKSKISHTTKEAMKNVNKELLGKKSVEARKPFWDNKHEQQKKKILELKEQKIPIKKIIAELNISVPTYYKLWNQIK